MSQTTSDIMQESREVLYEEQGEKITMESMYKVLAGINERLSTIEKKVTKIDDLGHTINTLATNFGQMKLKIDNVDKSVNDLKKRCTEQENNMQAVKNENSRIGRELKELKSNFNQRSQDLQGISNIMDDFKEKQDKSIHEMKNLKTSISKVANDLDDESLEIRQEIKAALNDLREENEDLRDKLLDQQCRSMKYNLVFNGIIEDAHENTENVIRSFIHQELRIHHRLEFANVHRFGSGAPTGRNRNARRRPIVARFIYHRDLEMVISNAYRLKGTNFTIKRQFPEAIEQARRSLYPVLKEKRDQGHRVKLVKDILYVDGLVYNEETDSTWSQTESKTESPTVGNNRTPDNSQRSLKRRRTGTPRDRPS